MFGASQRRLLVSVLREPGSGEKILKWGADQNPQSRGGSRKDALLLTIAWTLPKTPRDREVKMSGVKNGWCGNVIVRRLALPELLDFVEGMLVSFIVGVFSDSITLEILVKSIK